MSVFKGHEDLSLNRYYYSFYSFSQSDPNTIKSFVYDQNQTLISSQDISFNSRNVPAMLTFLENSQVNPYALGKSNDEYLNMDIAFAGVYHKALSQRQQRTLMTFVNNTYKNVYYGTVEKYIVTIGDNGGTPVVYFNGDTSDPNPLAIIHSNGLYIFDQSDQSNANYQLAFRDIDTKNPYTTNVIIEGTPGTPNSYSVITVDNTTPTNLEYYINYTELDIGDMKGKLFMGVYVVKTVENWASQTVFTIKAPFQDVYYDQPDLSFNSGDIAYFYVGDTTMTDFSLVFGPTVDSFDNNFYSSYVSKSGNVLTLDLLSDYTGGAVYYFEDTSAGMGYVEASTITTPHTDIDPDNTNRTYSDHYTELSGRTLNNSVISPGGGDLCWALSATGTNNIDNSIYTSNMIIDCLSEIGIVGFRLRPRGGYSQYVKAVIIDYSSDGSTYYNVDDGSLFDATAESGNKDFIFTTPVLARYIKIIPRSYNSHPSMKVGLIQGTITNVYPVTVANGVFVIDTGSGAQSKPQITFTNRETYIFDQSDPSNAGFPIVFGETPESSTLYTTGVTVVGTPGQPGAYTKLEYNDTIVALYYYNNIIPGMGHDPNAYSYYVTVAGTSPKFYLNSVQQPVIFTANTKYYFYQYDSTNEKYPIIFGTVEDTEPYFTDGVTEVGTPGQSGAYTILVLSDGFTGSLFYFSSRAPDMGVDATYTIKVVQNWAGNNVFSIQAPGEDISYNQPDLSFNAGDIALFDVGDSTMSDYSLVFGTEIDNADNILDSRYVTDLGSLIGLNLPSNYTGGAVYYFEDTSAGMGYVEPVVVHKIVELQSDGFFTLTGSVDSADLSYCAIGGGGAGGYGHFGANDESRGGNGGNGGQVIYGNHTFENSIYYEINIGAGGIGNTLATNSTGGATSILSGYTIVNASGGLKGGYGDSNDVTPVNVVPKSSTGAQAVNTTSDTPSPGENGTGPFNYGAGGGAGASAGTVGNKSSQGGNYGGGAGGFISADTAARAGQNAVANTGSGGGGGSGNGASTRYYGGNGGSGVVVIYVETKSYSFTGTKNETTVDVIVNPYIVTVSNEAFFIDTGSGAQSKPKITFTDEETYVFDQSDESNAGYPIVFGETKDSTPYYTNGVTVVGTPGQPGAYTRIDYTGSTALVYFSSGAIDMGYNAVLTENTSRFTDVSYPQTTTVTVANNHKLYKFIAYPTNNSNSKYQSHYQFTLDQTTTVHYVVVGGGGAGGRYVATTAWTSAGGGGGEVMQGTVVLQAGTYDVKVGSGGHWTSNTILTGGASGYMMDGFQSLFNTITARGGKGGPASYGYGRQTSYKTYGLGGKDSNGGDGKQVSVNGVNIWLGDGGGGGGGDSSTTSYSGGQDGGGNGGYNETKSTAGTNEKGGGGGAGASGYSDTSNLILLNKWGYGSGNTLMWVDETNFGGSGVVYLWHELESYV